MSRPTLLHRDVVFLLLLSHFEYETSQVLSRFWISIKFGSLKCNKQMILNTVVWLTSMRIILCHFAIKQLFLVVYHAVDLLAGRHSHGQSIEYWFFWKTSASNCEANKFHAILTTKIAIDSEDRSPNQNKKETICICILLSF